MNEDELCPGIKHVVLWLNSLGYKTTDSGDGSHYMDGMDCAVPDPMVVIEFENEVAQTDGIYGNNGLISSIKKLLNKRDRLAFIREIAFSSDHSLNDHLKGFNVVCGSLGPVYLCLYGDGLLDLNYVLGDLKEDAEDIKAAEKALEDDYRISHEDLVNKRGLKD